MVGFIGQYNAQKIVNLRQKINEFIISALILENEFIMVNKLG